MTIRELIEALKEHNPDIEVASYDSGKFFWAIPPEIRMMHTSPKMAGGPWECTAPVCPHCNNSFDREPVAVL
jgi:hypothetical protein